MLGLIWFQTVCKSYQQMTLVGKATPNKFLDSHPNFVKNFGGWEVLIFTFYFSDCFKNITVLKETFNTMKLSKLINDKH